MIFAIDGLSENSPHWLIYSTLAIALIEAYLHDIPREIMRSVVIKLRRRFGPSIISNELKGDFYGFFDTFNHSLRNGDREILRKEIFKCTLVSNEHRDKVEYRKKLTAQRSLIIRTQDFMLHQKLALNKINIIHLSLIKLAFDVIKISKESL